MCGRTEVSVRTMKVSRKAMGLPVCEAARFLEEPSKHMQIYCVTFFFFFFVVGENCDA